MYGAIFELVEERMQQLEQKGILKDKQLFVAPVNYVTMYLIKWLQERNYCVNAVISEKENFLDQTLLGVKIKKAEEALIPYRKNTVILLTDASLNYLNRKMDVMEYYYNVQRYVVTEPRMVKKNFAYFKQAIKKKVWRYSLQGIHKLYKGKKIYNSLKKCISEKGNIALFPYNSIGDIYILGCYRNLGVSVFNNECTLVVIGNICKKIALEMGFQKVICIKQSEMDDIIRFKDVFFSELSDVDIVHYNYSFMGIADTISNHKNINFFQNYQHMVFDGKSAEFLRIQEKNSELENYCRTNGIIKGKTVILAPYAKSILSVSIVFWETLANMLRNNGYTVFTNCGKDSELTIEGTKRILFPIEMANLVVEYAGFFVGLRSGLCDLISCSKCKKVIIYPKWENDNTSIKDFYTFENIKGCIKLKEYECEINSGREDAKKVVKLIQSFRENNE